nr:immunoglobulin heavy chain junction region [Mus musculus]
HISVQEEGAITTVVVLTTL